MFIIQFLSSHLWDISFAFLGVLLYIILWLFLKKNLRILGPDRVLIVTGRRTTKYGRRFGFRVRRGKAIVLPYINAMDSLSLEVIPINIRVDGITSTNGIIVGAEAAVCVCVDADDEAQLYKAVERLSGKSAERIAELIKQVLVGNFRAALNQATPLEALGMALAGDSLSGETMRATFRSELMNAINANLQPFGMKAISLSLQRIWDASGYITNLAQKTVTEKRRQTLVEEAGLRALAEQAESDAAKRTAVAKARAEELVAAARRELEVFRSEAEGRVAEARLTADQAIAAAGASGGSAVQAETAKRRLIKNKTELTLPASAKEEAARILAEGQRAAILIREQARNDILGKKAALLAEFGGQAAAMLFLKQKLPVLLSTYNQAAAGTTVERLVALDDPAGFAGAVNRGPRAFQDFLESFADLFGIDFGGLTAAPGTLQATSETASAADIPSVASSTVKKGGKQ